ncbi:unnamed protein product [Meganyctiphanes norvegica]|uniref:Secreted protein n=1 Tax=Meganyctiphanes norvegica TaxID=48144 RepID=A0AAV2S691_MEGNR
MVAKMVALYWAGMCPLTATSRVNKYAGRTESSAAFLSVLLITADSVCPSQQWQYQPITSLSLCLLMHDNEVGKSGDVVRLSGRRAGPGSTLVRAQLLTMMLACSASLTPWQSPSGPLPTLSLSTRCLVSPNRGGPGGFDSGVSNMPLGNPCSVRLPVWPRENHWWFWWCQVPLAQQFL